MDVPLAGSDSSAWHKIGQLLSYVHVTWVRVALTFPPIMFITRSVIKCKISIIILVSKYSSPLLLTITTFFSINFI